jgi:hypothetical protein
MERMITDSGGEMTFSSIVHAALESYFKGLDGEGMEGMPERVSLLVNLLEEKAREDQKIRSKLERGLTELRNVIAYYERARNQRDQILDNRLSKIENTLDHLRYARKQ